MKIREIQNVAVQCVTTNALHTYYVDFQVFLNFPFEGKITKIVIVNLNLLIH